MAAAALRPAAACCHAATAAAAASSSRYTRGAARPACTRKNGTTPHSARLASCLTPASTNPKPPPVPAPDAAATPPRTYIQHVTSDLQSPCASEHTQRWCASALRCTATLYKISHVGPAPQPQTTRSIHLALQQCAHMLLPMLAPHQVSVASNARFKDISATQACSQRGLLPCPTA